MNRSTPNIPFTTESRPRPATGSHRRTRFGFTLVELLTVIAVIGILVGLLAVGLRPAIITAREGAVRIEMKQLETAIENFRNQNGFYPPSFARINELAGPRLDPASTHVVSLANRLAIIEGFISRMAPNHRENSLVPGTTSLINSNAQATRLEVWYDQVGRHLDDTSSMVFWLSGVCANKQFPLTGGLGQVNNQLQVPVAYNAPLNGANGVQLLAADGTPLEALPRNVLFDFNSSQLVVDEISRFNRDRDTMAFSGVAFYEMPFGDSSADPESLPDQGEPAESLRYIYRDSGSYNLALSAATSLDASDALSMIALDSANNPRRVFFNPNSFQIITFGLDGEAAPIGDLSQGLSALGGPLMNQGPSAVTDPAIRSTFQAANRDNIANFAEGRLDVFLSQQ